MDVWTLETPSFTWIVQGPDWILSLQVVGWICHHLHTLCSITSTLSHLICLSTRKVTLDPSTSAKLYHPTGVFFLFEGYLWHAPANKFRFIKGNQAVRHKLECPHHNLTWLFNKWTSSGAGHFQSNQRQITRNGASSWKTRTSWRDPDSI